jgi:uncharacterized protein
MKSPQKTVLPSQPLQENEIKRLAKFLASCKGGEAMNLEELDGFFGALIAGPEMVMPSEYYAKVFGGEMADVCEFARAEEASEILGLMMRHWNALAAALYNGGVIKPILLPDENGNVQGNDWAHGFITATVMRRDGWAKLIDGAEEGRCMLPIFALHWEHSSNPKLRAKKPIGPEEREELIVGMVTAMVQAYLFFRQPRRAEAGGRSPKTCRNPC